MFEIEADAVPEQEQEADWHSERHDEGLRIASNVRELLDGHGQNPPQGVDEGLQGRHGWASVVWGASTDRDGFDSPPAATAAKNTSSKVTAEGSRVTLVRPPASSRRC